jgi:molybdopterin molybdotransferase
VRETQAKLRVEEIFWGVAIKPGKPVAFGVRRDHLVFNLPGNPVSVLVTFEVLVRPAVNALLGVSNPLPSYHRGVLARAVRRNPHRDEFLRARRSDHDGEVVLEPLSGQESHMIVRAGQADALVAVAAGDGEVPKGAQISFLAV